MKWPGFLQKLLRGCFGHEDEPKDSQHNEPKSDTDDVPPAIPKIPDQQPAQNEPQHEADIAQSSHNVSERQQSDQSHSDANRLETQPTSVETSSKVDSSPNEITASNSSPPAPNTSADPDAITPVEVPKTRYVSVTEALEDRRKLYDRLRRKPDGESPPSESQTTSTAAVSKANGKQPEAESLGQK